MQNLSSSTEGKYQIPVLNQSMKRKREPRFVKSFENCYAFNNSFLWRISLSLCTKYIHFIF